MICEFVKILFAIMVFVILNLEDLIEVNFAKKEQQKTNSKKIEVTMKGEKPSCKGGTMPFISFQSSKAAHLLYNCNKQFEIGKDGNVTTKSIFDS